MPKGQHELLANLRPPRGACWAPEMVANVRKLGLDAYPSCVLSYFVAIRGSVEIRQTKKAAVRIVHKEYGF